MWSGGSTASIDGGSIAPIARSSAVSVRARWNARGSAAGFIATPNAGEPSTVRHTSWSTLSRPSRPWTMRPRARRSSYAGYGFLRTSGFMMMLACTSPRRAPRLSAARAMPCRVPHRTIVPPTAIPRGYEAVTTSGRAFGSGDTCQRRGRIGRVTRNTHRVGVRKIGVEEEFLLVDARGTPRPVGEVVVALARENESDGVGGAGDELAAGIEHELQLEQAETGTPPTVDLGELGAFILERRVALAGAAGERGSAPAALGTSPMPVSPTTTPDERYERMMHEYGATAQEQLTCGCHVHVDIASRAEGVAAINGMGPWLPVIAALGVNSPFWQGEDTGYAGYRRMVWNRWPGSGATEPFADDAEYDDAVAAMVRSGILMDDAMIYFDARLSARYPTVEVRVADVQPETADTVLIAALVRALVDTAASPPPGGHGRPRLELLRGAGWRAARSGLSGNLVDVLHGTAVPAAEMVGRLVDHVRPALRANGDLDLVESSLQRLMSRGTGADLQRAAHRRRGRLSDVVADAVQRTVSPL